MSRDDATLLHIVAAAKRALAFLGGASFDSFLQDEKTPRCAHP